MRILGLIGCVGLALNLCPGCGSDDDASKDEIVFGQAWSLTGAYAKGADVLGRPVYDLWIEQVNAEGGIFVKKYNKKLPIRLLRYDDESNETKMLSLLEKLIVEDKVDILLPPWGSNLFFAAAPVANNHKKVLIAGPAQGIKLKELIGRLPYTFVVLNSPDTQMPALADILLDAKIKKAGIGFVQDLYGIENSQVASTEMAQKGIDVAMLRSFPLGTKDFSALLAEAQEKNVEAFLAFTYPDETFAMTGQAMALDFNPKVFFTGVGTFLPAYRDAFGGAEGVMGPGGWSRKASQGAEDFWAAYKKKWNQEPDYWGSLWYYSSMQFLKQAIEKAGSLDQAQIREIVATTTFETAMGPMRFEGGFNTNHPGEISQWQNGVFEIIGPANKKTAEPNYLKPTW
jgi:branched-chain amino acid transport system substrate-binding protein